MDTVPPFIESSEDEEFIYGRGSCDAKGIIAAQIFAAERLRAEGVNDIGLLFTVDEELGSHWRTGGEQTSARARVSVSSSTASRLTIVWQPAPKDLCVCIITTEGRAAHSAYPEAGESAIEKLLDILQDIRALRVA